MRIARASVLAVAVSVGLASCYGTPGSADIAKENLVQVRAEFEASVEDASRLERDVLDAALDRDASPFGARVMDEISEAEYRKAGTRSSNFYVYEITYDSHGAKFSALLRGFGDAANWTGQHPFEAILCVQSSAKAGSIETNQVICPDDLVAIVAEQEAHEMIDLDQLEG